MTTTPPADERISLVYLLTSALRHEAGMPEEDACRIAQNLMNFMSRERGGEYVYCPELSVLTRYQRNEAIRREWTGNNAKDLMARHNVSRATLYRVLGIAPEPAKIVSPSL